MANLSQIRREQMIAFLEKLKEQHNDDESLIAFNQIEKELTSKKYGLVWEDHEEDVDILLKTKIPVFSEVTKREVKSSADNSYNFLIEGDNLHSLYLLDKALRGKIDVIYIDPPYNTGAKNWKYNNDYVDGLDTFKHSKWISFMDHRLRVARSLLADDGVLILTIDDYEIENITLLLNEIFGEENHLGTVVIKNNPQGRSSVTGFQVSHEYALFYGKEKSRIKTLPRNEAQIARYGERDDIGPFEWRNFRAQYSMESPTMVYPIYVKKDCSDFRIPNMKWNSETKEYDVNDNINDDEIVTWPRDEQGRMRTWKWGIETVLKEKDTQMGVRKDRSGNPAVYFKGRMKSEGMQPYTFWDDPRYSASTFGANVLADILGKKKFDYPKSIHAVADCIRVASDKPDALILDFFAGSGTTGQAVLQLNSEDGGHRRFILCTNNENSICEDVTYPRVKTVITGKRDDGSSYLLSDKTRDVLFDEKLSLAMLNIGPDIIAETKQVIEKNKSMYDQIKTVFEDNHLKVIGTKTVEYEGIPANLKYYKTDFVDRADEELTDLLLDHVIELIQLQYGIKVDGQQYIVILNDDEMDSFESNYKSYTELRSVFISQDVMLSTSQEKLIESINAYIIPDCYFDSELREAGEIW